MNAHTPGPWTIRKAGHSLNIGLEKPNEHGPAWFESVLPSGRGYSEQRSGAKRGESPTWYGWSERTKANAKLIAAAPDLLEALQIMLSAYAPEDENWQITKARAALAKATGQ